MDDNETLKPKPPRQPTEAVEDVSLALREHLLWPIEDGFLGLTLRGHDVLAGNARRPRIAILAGGAAALLLAVAITALMLGGSGGSEPARQSTVAVIAKSPVQPSPAKGAAKPAPAPTLQGAKPVFESSPEQHRSAKPKAEAPTGHANAANSGNPATDTISSTPAARPATAAASAASAAPDGPPAGPAAVAVARKFASAFVVYEVGSEEGGVRKTFEATAIPEVVRALMQRPPRQPAGVEVPKAKVLNVVPAPSHERIYPVSVSLLRVGATSELRLELERLKNKQWRVTNVLG
jgi:hypothetical protein